MLSPSQKSEQPLPRETPPSEAEGSGAFRMGQGQRHHAGTRVSRFWTMDPKGFLGRKKSSKDRRSEHPGRSHRKTQFCVGVAILSSLGWIAAMMLKHPGFAIATLMLLLGPQSSSALMDSGFGVIAAVTLKHPGLTVATLLLLMGPQPSSAFMAYDCNSPNASYEAISLLETEPCPDAQRDYRRPVNFTVQLLHRQEARYFEAVRCDYRVTISVHQCGFDSIRYHQEVLAQHQRIDIGAKECQKIADDGSFLYQGQVIAAKLDQEIHHVLYTEGRVKDNGACETKDFWRNGRHYQGYYEMHVLTGRSWKVKGKTEVGLPLAVLGGTVSDIYTHGHTYSTEYGNYVWPVEEPQCKETYSQIHVGTAQVHQRADVAPHILNEALAVFEERRKLRDEDRSIAVIFQGDVRACGRPCFTTQIPGILACVYREGETVEPFAFKKEFEQDRIIAQVQLQYNHVRTSIDNNADFSRIVADMCEMKDKWNRNVIRDLSGADNKHALMERTGPGHQLTRSGAVIYVTRCAPVNVTRTEYKNCTQEIPVLADLGDKRGERLLFADPITYALTETPVELPCDTVFPIRWHIQGRWFCATPRVVSCDPPRRLPINHDPFQERDHYTHLGSHAYTQAQLDAHKNTQLEYHALGASVAKNAHWATTHGQPGESTSTAYRMGLPISDVDEEIMKLNILGRLSLFIPTFGDAWRWLTGIGLILSILYLLAATAARVFYVYRREGCGLWAFGAVFGVIFSLFYLPMRIFRNAFRDVTGQMDRMAVHRSLRGPRVWPDGSPRDRDDGGDPPQPPPPPGPSGASTRPSAPPTSAMHDLMDLEAGSGLTNRKEPYRVPRRQMETMPDLQEMQQLATSGVPQGTEATGPAPGSSLADELQQHQLRRTGLFNHRLSPPPDYSALRNLKGSLRDIRQGAGALLNPVIRGKGHRRVPGSWTNRSPGGSSSTGETRRTGSLDTLFNGHSNKDEAAGDGRDAGRANPSGPAPRTPPKASTGAVPRRRLPGAGEAGRRATSRGSILDHGAPRARASTATLAEDSSAPGGAAASLGGQLLEGPPAPGSGDAAAATPQPSSGGAEGPDLTGVIITGLGPRSVDLAVP